MEKGRVAQPVSIKLFLKIYEAENVDTKPKNYIKTFDFRRSEMFRGTKTTREYRFAILIKNIKIHTCAALGSVKTSVIRAKAYTEGS